LNASNSIARALRLDALWKLPALHIRESCPLANLPAVAEGLRHVVLPRTGWGHWRAVAHDFVYEVCVEAAGVYTGLRLENNEH